MDNNNLQTNSTIIEFNVLDASSDDGFDGLREQVDVSVTDDENLDEDGDGVSKYYEQQVLNGGDGNNVGTQDHLQEDVVGLVLETGEQVILDANGCGLDNIQIIQESDLSVTDPAYDYPDELIDFKASCPQLTIDIYTTHKNSILRKFTDAYGDIDGVVAGSIIIDAQGLTKYTYTAQDGGELDAGPAGGYNSRSCRFRSA